MHTADTSKLPKLLLLGVASATLANSAPPAPGGGGGRLRTPGRHDTGAHRAEHTMDSAPRVACGRRLR